MTPLRLEVFEAPSSTTGTVVTDVSALEEARLAAFENGYTAGWEDAGAAQAEDQTRLRADLARNLQALSFTYHEARAHVVMALQPLLTDVIDRVLPQMARETLGATLREQLVLIGKDMADAPITLVLNPSSREAVLAMLDDTVGLPVRIVEEPTLGEGQAYLRFETNEIRIDSDRIVTDLQRAIRSFFALAEKGITHG